MTHAEVNAHDEYWNVFAFLSLLASEVRLYRLTNTTLGGTMITFKRSFKWPN